MASGSTKPDTSPEIQREKVTSRDLRRVRTHVIDAAVREHLSDSLTPSGLSGRPPPQKALKILNDAMQNSPDDEKLQFKAILSLIRMSVKTEERDLIADNNNVEPVLRAMRSFSNNDDIIHNGCIFLANAAFECPLNKAAIRKHGGIELIVRNASAKENDEKLHCWVFLAVRNITNNSAEYQTQAEASGAIELLARGLRRFAKNRSLTTHGITAVGNISEGGLKCQTRIREAGCLDIIIDAMKKNIAAQTFLEHCIVSLTSICTKNEKNQVRFCDMGGMDTFADIVRERKPIARLCFRICLALRQICFHKRAREDIGRTGLLISMLGMQECVIAKYGAKGAEAVFKAMSNALCDEDENMKILARGGGVRAVMNVLRQQLSDASILGFGLGLFRNMCDQRGVNYDHFMEASVFQFSLDCMELYREDLSITEHSLELVACALRNSGEEKGLGRTLQNGRELVSAQLDRFAGEARIQETGSEVISLIDEEEGRRAGTFRRKASTFLLGNLKKMASSGR